MACPMAAENAAAIILTVGVAVTCLTNDSNVYRMQYAGLRFAREKPGQARYLSGRPRHLLPDGIGVAALLPLQAQKETLPGLRLGRDDLHLRVSRPPAKGGLLTTTKQYKKQNAGCLDANPKQPAFFGQG